MEIHICSITEYDAETRMPTIVNPDSSTFYLVPTEDGTSPDLFTEWVYVNGAWEMFGSAKIDLSGYLTDVQINGQSIVSDGVADIPIASVNNAGVAKVHPDYGITVLANTFKVNSANDARVKAGANANCPIVPANQHVSTFYGLAKAAGDTTQSQSSNAVGSYTEEAKIAIQKMLGVQGQWELLVNETLAEDNVDNRFYFEKDCTEIFVYIKVLQGQTTTTLTFNVENEEGTLIFYRYLSGQISSTKDTESIIHFQSMKGMSVYEYNLDNGASQVRRMVSFKDLEKYAIHTISITGYGSTVIPAGSIFKIYGR